MSSTIQKVVAYHIKRLQDKDAAIRMKAIRELELLAHPSALDALREVYETDVDMDVRKAAQEAGRQIFLKNKTTGDLSQLAGAE